jgi:hypothetical protein
LIVLAVTGLDQRRHLFGESDRAIRSEVGDRPVAKAIAAPRVGGEGKRLLGVLSLLLLL